LLISAHDEEDVIADKLRNSLALDYPRDKLEIIVASDGSTDRTSLIVDGFKSRGVKLYEYSRRGKTGIQNEAVKKAEGEIIVFSDANAIYKPDALRKLVRNFGDDRIGCVCGQLVYLSEKDGEQSLGEKWYWGYEKLLKKFESRASSLIGVNGSIYAIRKEDYIDLDESLISDLVEPLKIIRAGKKVVYESEAVSEEPLSGSYRIEFLRKIRILTRSIQGILHEKTLLNPLRYGIISVEILVHKMFRYIIPVVLMISLLALIFLSDEMPYFIIFWCISVFLVLGIIGKFLPEESQKYKICHLSYYYVLVNYAVILAWINVVKGERIDVWSTSRD
jgi:cellulose synthase/poly-beta-1,6-N-acetylglucosamine synthase-like glycosyltransferase